MGHYVNLMTLTTKQGKIHDREKVVVGIRLVESCSTIFLGSFKTK